MVSLLVSFEKNLYLFAATSRLLEGKAVTLAESTPFGVRLQWLTKKTGYFSRASY